MSVRVIPAWAGNTRRCASPPRWWPGHPRVGGEHGEADTGAGTQAGSSPRGRGTHTEERDDGQGGRVIPAWAGNTNAAGATIPPGAGHPRVGGEHGALQPNIDADIGSSPRGRGTLNGVVGVIRHHRVIPAWAGNTQFGCWLHDDTPGHPRVGGEHVRRERQGRGVSGSSPRGRGTRRGPEPAARYRRVIPAWAGNTGPLFAGAPPLAGHPRVGGEHIVAMPTGTGKSGSSPRGRGTRPPSRPAASRPRVIPAWAGNTLEMVEVPEGMTGHPRVGGEHPRHSPPKGSQRGSSPRGRGTRRQGMSGPWCCRVIPAWAGNTVGSMAAMVGSPGHPRVGGEHSCSRRKDCG